MNELFYFAFADLMVRVEYDKKANSLRYASHRRMASGERMVIEQYVLTSIAAKTDYYKRQSSRFIYLGVETQLIKNLNNFHYRATPEKEMDATASVKGLINQSMQNYYFEQIGDAIVAMRQELRNGAAPARVAPFRRKMEELVEAYNHYAEQKISVAEVIPSELQTHFSLPARSRSYEEALVEEEVD
ncbi:MAG: hypothetical protein ACREOI_07720 [bacterium]